MYDTVNTPKLIIDEDYIKSHYNIDEESISFILTMLVTNDQVFDSIHNAITDAITHLHPKDLCTTQ